MKKITLLCFVLLAFSYQGFAQLNEGFDAPGLPAGWAETIISGSGNDWAFGATQNQNASIAPRTGAGMAYYFEGSYAGETNRLETPSLDLTSLTTPVLTFYFTQVDWGGDQDELSIWYKDSAAGTWTMITEYTTSVTSWTKVDIILPNPSADYYIGFQGYSFWGRGITIDDVSVGEAPNCLDPGSLGVTITSTTTTTLNWLASGSETDFTYEYGAVGYTQGTGQIGGGPVVGMNSADITGLTPGNQYDFYVQANCGVDGDSGFAGPFTWTQPDSGESCGTAIVAVLEADCGTATPISLDFTGAPSNISTSCDTFNNYGLWITATTDATGGLTVNASAAVDMAIFDTCSGTDLACYNADISPSVDVVLSPNTQYYLYFWQEGTASTAMVDVCLSSYTVPDPPNCATTPFPADDAVDIPTGAVTFTWVAPAAGPTPTSYNVYVYDDDLGTNPVLVGNFPTETADLTINAFNTEIFWNAIPANGAVEATGCDIWSFTTEAFPGYCLTAVNGQWPGGAAYVPATCDGTTVNEVTTGGWASEYSLVTVTAGETYQFNSSAPDLITISYDGASEEAFGVSSVTWTAPVDGEVRFYTHLNDDNCGAENVDRTRSVLCGESLSIDDVENNTALTYFPNPVKNTLTLNAQNSIEKVVIYNVLGQEVLRVNPNNVDSEMDLSALNSGAYFVKVIIKGVAETVRVIKQ